MGDELGLCRLFFLFSTTVGMFFILLLFQRPQLSLVVLPLGSSFHLSGTKVETPPPVLFLCVFCLSKPTLAEVNPLSCAGIIPALSLPRDATLTPRCSPGLPAPCLSATTST